MSNLLNYKQCATRTI